MMEMTAQWRAWAQRVAALSLRERVLILLTGTILLGAAGIYGWLDAADTRLSQERQALTAAQRDLEILTLENQGKTALYVASGEQLIGVIAVADTLKEDARAAIAELRDMGIHTVMLTGDNPRAAAHIAAQVGIDSVHANVLPSGKVEVIRQLQGEYGQWVAMVGDGINDAPALKQANVGIAIGSGADVAMEAADVILIGGRLGGLVEAAQLSRLTFRKIVENLIWASAYNVAAIPIAAVGLLHPMIGVIAMTASSLSVIANSLLLKRAPLSVIRKTP